MNYSENENYCRVDLWKPSGKWQTTIAVKFLNTCWSDCLIHEAFKQALLRYENIKNCTELYATCLEPYHEYSHPISIKIEESWFTGESERV